MTSSVADAAWSRQQPLQDEQCGKNEKRPRHVRIVERSARAPVEEEHVRTAPEQVEIGRNGHERGDDRRRQIAAGEGEQQHRDERDDLVGARLDEDEGA
jgi:hypothetical protein